MIGGSVLLRDGKVGTEQACCCEVCNESVGETCYQIECVIFEATQQDAQDYLDRWLADYEQFAAEANIVQAYTDAGYSNAASSAEGFIFPADTLCFGEEGLWSMEMSWGFGAQCCGNKFIDYDAEPVLISTTSFPPPNNDGCSVGDYYPPVTGRFPTPDDPYYMLIIYPCVDNPLP
jgi:hypothetical protein